MTPVINLDKYKDSFKSEEEFLRFADEFGGLTGDEMVLVIYADRLVASLFPPEEAQKRIQEKIIRRLATDPSLLETLQKRIESDDLVS